MAAVQLDPTRVLTAARRRSPHGGGGHSVPGSGPAPEPGSSLGSVTLGTPHWCWGNHRAIRFNGNPTLVLG
ncbi:unnamed protein product [Boreogadus saida]